MPRLRILNTIEREAYEKPPVLTAAERRRAFDLPSSLRGLAGTVGDPVQRIGLLVSAAYFASARRFFSPRDYRERDVVHAARQLRLAPELFEPDRYPARARQRHEVAILEAHGMRRQHDLYRALKAFGQIIKTLFVLRYVDEIDLRQAIEQQLSRIELAHRFTRDVAVGNPREFDHIDKESQEVAESCNRLIKNAIVCWNYLYFEQRLKGLTDPAEKQALIDTISRHSMISWRHVNMLGEYDFSDERLKDSFGLRPPKPIA